MKYKYSIITLVTSTIFILLFFISLLGENHHIDDLITHHISKLEKERYSNNCVPISINSEVENELSCNQDSFIFYVSLLERFDLFSAENYYIKVTRDVFWIPFYSDDVVKVSLSIVVPEANAVGIFKEYEYISDLFIVKRQNSGWVLDEASIMEPALIKIFNQMKNNINFNKYTTKTENGYQFSNIEIDTKNISNVDKLLLKFSLQKINNDLN
jgi:hypothetical protein